MKNITNSTYSLLDVREMERERIAKDLHDYTLQNLSHLIHKIELSSLYIDRDPVQAKLELATAEQELRNIIDNIRTVVYNLHPMTLDDLGLKVTIERMLDIIHKKCNFIIEADVEDVSCENKVVAVAILRLFQECCYNAVKHSHGTKIYVSLALKNEKYILKVIDNGIGFNENEVDQKNSHFGLPIMKESICLLNGKMKINSSDKGTSVEIEIPYKSDLSN